MDNQIVDSYKSTFERYGLKKPSMFSLKKIGFFADYLFLFGKRVLEVGKLKSFGKEDLWKLPPELSTEQLYPPFKEYYLRKMSNPSNKDRIQSILFKYVNLKRLDLCIEYHGFHLGHFCFFSGKYCRVHNTFNPRYPRGVDLGPKR